MALSQTTTKKIRFIIAKYGLYMRYRLLGPGSLKKSELVQLVNAGLISKADARKPIISDAYVSAHTELLHGESRKSVRDYSIKHIHDSAGSYIDKFMDKTAMELGNIVQQQMHTQRNQSISALRGELEAGTGKKTNSQIAHELRKKTGDLYKDWRRVVTTELAEATNLGAFDAICENNREKSPDDVYVYKSGPHDGKTCDHCMRFWFTKDGVTPKVYRLSDLVANGSNVGKKVADWKPTVSVTHPNERHYLLEIPNGWGFSSEGGITYKGRKHVELNHQNEK